MRHYRKKNRVMLTQRLEQLVDLQTIRNLLESYYNLTGISCTLFDTEQNILIAVGWQEICTQFHRAHPVSKQRCKRSNAAMLYRDGADSDNVRRCQEYRCENGMIYVSLPILVGITHVGTLVSGKFFFKDAQLDRGFFTTQATELGFDHESYLSALDQVPVLQRDYVCHNMQFLNNMVSMLAATGGANLTLADRTLKLQQELKARTEVENALHIQAVMLEDEIAERQKAQEELQLSNRQLESANRALRLLSASNQTLLRCTDEEELLVQICRIAVEIGGYSTGWVGLALHDEEKSVVPLACFGIDAGLLEEARMSWGEGAHGTTAMATAIRTGTVQIRQDVLHDPTLAPWHAHARKHNFQSAIALPLQMQDTVIGALAIYAPEPHAFQEAEVALLKELASDLAFGIQTIRDRQTHEKAQGHIHQLAYYDRLTGLPNQFLFLQQLEQDVVSASTEGHTFSLLLLDLNYLREINETHGHTLGDQILVRIASQLQEICGPSCFVARFGGNFAIICPNSDQVVTTHLAETILTAISPAFYLSGHRLNISGGIGMAIYPEDAQAASELLSKADLATSRAMVAGGGFCFYRPEMGECLARTLKLAHYLEHALLEDVLQLYYQPKIDLITGRLVGAEALLRWYDSVFGWISPAEFVAIAETRGMMIELGRWVLRRACYQIRQWQQQGNPHPGRIAINVSVCQLEATDFIETVLSAVESAGISPDSIELELTESILMSDPEQAVTILNRLRSKGFSLAIDDFGTGYSSLAYLKRLPINTLKIDQAFVRDMLHDSGNRAIVAAIIAMARQLGLTTVAEGVEELEQSLELLELGCSQAQGFYFGRPVSADEFRQRWLDTL